MLSRKQEGQQEKRSPCFCYGFLRHYAQNCKNKHANASEKSKNYGLGSSEKKAKDWGGFISTMTEDHATSDPADMRNS